jgi:hypothetical protein
MNWTAMGFIAVVLIAVAFGFLLGVVWAGIRREDDMQGIFPFDDTRIERVRREYDPDRFMIEGENVVGVGPTMYVAYQSWLEAFDRWRSPPKPTSANQPE